MKDIVYLGPSDIETVLDMLKGATAARVAISDGGLKISANQGMWTLPIGSV